MQEVQKFADSLHGFVEAVTVLPFAAFVVAGLGVVLVAYFALVIGKSK